jgi:hypothetical protein
MPKPYELAQDWLMNNLDAVVKHLFPAGQIRNNEFLIGNIDGDPGDSLHISLKGSNRGCGKISPPVTLGARTYASYGKQPAKSLIVITERFFRS